MGHHQEVKELIPWFVNGTLSESEQDLVNTHVESCEECRREIQEEIVTAKHFKQEDNRLAAQLADLEGRQKQAFKRLSERVNSSSPAAQAQGRQEQTSKSLSERIHSSSAAAQGQGQRKAWQWAFAASVLVAFIGVSSFMLGRHSQQADYVGLTSPTIAAEGVLQIVFHSHVSDEDLQTIIANTRGESLGVASPRRVYRVAMPEGLDAKQVSRQLREHPAIQWVEVEQP